MASQEFLASFGVEIDESGLDKLQKALAQNRTLAEELASAVDSARTAVDDFFRQLCGSCRFLYVFLLKKCNNNKEKQIGCVIINSHNCVIMCDLA